ncbi:hypothetical protein [Oceanicoccus sagamiensis]|uniref:HNH domain-containing protein n=1 Tax=Oceanicoccus sagamiensis TaxID=716816 RepID=A0A1X9NB70_9GAMM|nr:hypothetical protein [Oceanicoccus sagamiensis]ARN75300.1 hypothetical protein BST96_14965 [Oceanicoccus sagamiensis]
MDKLTDPDNEVEHQRRGAQVGSCPLCQRQTNLTFHHLIPKKMHRRSFFKKHYKRQQLAAGIYICRQCHTGIHTLFTEMTLAKELNTVKQLRQNKALNKHCRWVARQHISQPDHLPVPF